MSRALTKLLPEDHPSIEKRSCKRRDNNERPKYQNVRFALSRQVLYNDVSSCFLVCADSDPMASVWLFCFDRIWRAVFPQNRFCRKEKKKELNPPLPGGAIF